MVKKEVTVESLRGFSERFVQTEAGRSDIGGWWQRPLLVSVSVDQRFDQLPDISYHEHLSPRDLLPTAKSVVAQCVSKAIKCSVLIGASFLLGILGFVHTSLPNPRKDAPSSYIFTACRTLD